MPAAGSLAALMKESRLNSVTLYTATHSKLREALDGTDTQVATCTSNRWMARMKGAEEYITREVSWRRDRNLEDTWRPSLCSIRGGEQELILGRGPRIDFHPSSTPLAILPDRWRSLRKGPVLKPASLPNSLYWACWVWVRSHLQWMTPQIETLQLASSVGRTCVLVRTIIRQGRAKPPRGNDDGQPTRPQMENSQEVPSLTSAWRHMRGPHPH